MNPALGMFFETRLHLQKYNYVEIRTIYVKPTAPCRNRILEMKCKIA